MDGREQMTSFYLSRGGPGSGHGGGSGHHGGGGGLHTPPPNFKTQSNPNTSPHGHSNMRVVSSMGFPHGINMGSGGAGGGGGGGGGLIATHGSGGESFVKKKRGRPRKYGPDGSHMALGLGPVPMGSSIPSGPKKNRGRPKGSGWKQRLANVGEWMNNSAGLAFTPHIIHVSVGEDVAEKILSFAQQRPRALCILSGNGAVSTVTLRQFTPSGGSTVTYEGRFEILRLSGSYLLEETGGPHNRTGGLSISVCSSDGQAIGGAIGGSLIASSLVQVVVCSFVYGGNTAKVKTKTESRDGNGSDVQVNERSTSIPMRSAPSQHFTQNSVAVSWPPDLRTGVRNSHTEIDLSRG